MYRRLAASNPTDYEADLASSLIALSRSLAEEARPIEAVAAAEEAVAMYRRLVATDPAAYESALATSLDNLSAGLVRRWEALLASLDNVWDFVALAANYQEALDPIEEAVTIFRRLAATDPAAYEPHLAASLRNLADICAWTGRRDGALAAAHEAVAIYRRLAAAEPAAYQPALVASLNRLSILEQAVKSFAGSLLIVVLCIQIFLGIAMVAVRVFGYWQSMKGQPLG